MISLAPPALFVAAKSNSAVPAIELPGAGGYYGPNGYPHLHLTMRAIHDDKLGTLGKPGEFAMNRDTTIIDPLTIYVPGVTTPTAADALAADAKRLTVAHVDGSGMIQPSAARFVWPVTCQ